MNPFIEEIFLRCFGSPQRLREYVSSDTDISQYAKNKYGSLIALAWSFLSKRQGFLDEVKTITHREILDLLKRKRPDLFQVINTSNEARLWFYKQNFQEFLKL